MLNFSPEELKDIEYLRKLPGHTIGTGLFEDKDFILLKNGETGIKKMNAALKEVGCYNYDDLQHVKWYPVSCNLISYLLFKKILGWDEETFREMGRCAPKTSILMRTMTKYFISPKILFDSAAKYWHKFYDVGSLEPIEIDEEKGYCLLMLKDFPGFHLFCRHLEGVFEQVAAFLNTREIKCYEVRCDKNGHLFKIMWVF